jgi:hypothetical protein
MGAGSDELEPGQAARDQVTEERQPAGAVLAGGDVQDEDLAVPAGVHPGRQERVHPDDAAALTDFAHERVGGDEGERTRIAQRVDA